MNQLDTVLVIGADGMIGRTLAARFAAEGRTVVRTTLLPTPRGCHARPGQVGVGRRRPQQSPISAPRSLRRTNAACIRQKAGPSMSAARWPWPRSLSRKARTSFFPPQISSSTASAPPTGRRALRPANRVRAAKGRGRTASAAIAGHLRGALHQGLGTCTAAPAGLDRGLAKGRGHSSLLRYAAGPCRWTSPSRPCWRSPRAGRKASSRYRPTQTSRMRRPRGSLPIALWPHRNSFSPSASPHRA